MPSDVLDQVVGGLLANGPLCELKCLCGVCCTMFTEIYLNRPGGNTDATVDNGQREMSR